jgi:hypothetical protein
MSDHREVQPYRVKWNALLFWSAIVSVCALVVALLNYL